MKLSLNEIKKRAYNEPFIFNKEVNLSELESMDNDIRKIKPVRIKGHCAVDGDQIIFSLTISGEMILPCARTLVDVLYPFEVQEVEIFTTSPYLSQEEIEDEIHHVAGEVIDLMYFIIENVLLDIDFRLFFDDVVSYNHVI